MNNLIINNFGITERNGQPVVSSRKVADKFNKEHDNVLRDIRNLDCSSQFSSLNFEESKYKTRGKCYPEYLMTKDGFTFLVMGYRGKKAAKFKESYINRFNEMETFIKNLNEARKEFPEFTDAIMQAHEEPKHYHFSNECNMINEIVLGISTRKFKKQNNITAKSIRPYLTAYQIEMVKTLQRIDIGLIVAIPDYYQRKTVLEQQYKRIQLKQLSKAV